MLSPIAATSSPMASHNSAASCRELSWTVFLRSSREYSTPLPVGAEPAPYEHNGCLNTNETTQYKDDIAQYPGQNTAVQSTASVEAD